MELLPRRKSDEEYVELIRRHTMRSKWFAVVTACVSILIIATIVYGWMRISAILGLRYPEYPEFCWLGFQLGLVLGVLAGLMILKATHYFLQTIKFLVGQRTERLMLKYHDELNAVRGIGHKGGQRW